MARSRVETESITSCWNRRRGWNTVRASERKSTGSSGGFEIWISGSKWQSTRKKPAETKRKGGKKKERKGRETVESRWNLRAKCKPGECSGKRQRAIRFVWQFSFVFIAPFRSLDSTLFPSRPSFSFALFYLIISRRCAMVPQFVYLVAYLAVCLSAFPRPVKPIYTNVRESSAEN